MDASAKQSKRNNKLLTNKAENIQMKWLVRNLRALAYWLENKASSNDGH